MMAEPMKTLELHNPMIQFLIISDIPQFLLGNIRSRDVFRPIAREQKDLMVYKSHYTMIYKNSERMCDSLDLFIVIVVLVFYILGAFLIKQFFHSRLLDMR